MEEEAAGKRLRGTRKGRRVGQRNPVRTEFPAGRQALWIWAGQGREAGEGKGGTDE